MTETLLTPSEAEAMDNRAEQQAKAQYESICAMLDAVDVDYERLQELKDERDELSEAVTEAQTNHAEAVRIGYAEGVHAQHLLDKANEAMNEWVEENGDELEELEADAGDCEDEDDARQRIYDDPLDVQVRSGWVNVGEELEADEFCILLCTGGPAVRIVGELDRGTPCRAWIEYQDWGTPWTQYFGAESSRLVAYASHFFG